MFTGIITEIGEIQKVQKQEKGVKFTILAPLSVSNLKIGASIAVDGVCLTVVEKGKEVFTVDVMPETLRVTHFGQVLEGRKCNLELPLRAGAFIDGHFVQGHVDEAVELKEIKREKSFVHLVLGFSDDMKQHVVYKGSVAINGVSLTVSDVQDDVFQVSLIPHTLEQTNLSDVQIGDILNIETDILSKYTNRR